MSLLQATAVEQFFHYCPKLTTGWSTLKQDKQKCARLFKRDEQVLTVTQ